MEKTQKRKGNYVPGGHKTRVQEFLKDVDYWHKLSEEERDWLLWEYVNPFLNNDLSDIEDKELKRQLDAHNASYGDDVTTNDIRIGLDKPAMPSDCVLHDAIESPQVIIRVNTKDEDKRTYTGKILTHRDWCPGGGAAEDALIAAIDAERDGTLQKKAARKRKGRKVRK